MFDVIRTESNFEVFKAIYELKLVPDNVFLVRLLPKVRGNLLTFWGVHKAWRFVGAM